MSTKCNLYWVEPVRNFFSYISNSMKCNPIKGEKNKEEKINRENEWKWPKCFGNLERNLQTQKGKQIDSKESQWQVVSL